MIIHNTNYKDSTGPLVKLIHSMSKAEKKQFRIHSEHKTGEPRYLILFDAIERSVKFNEPDLKKTRGINPAQLPNLKIQLYHKILHSIRSMRATRSVEGMVTDMVEEARILYDKCLYEDCLRMLVKARDLSIKHNMQVLLLGIYELEKKALGLISSHGTGHDRVVEIIDETNRHLQQIETTNTFSNLLLTLNELYRQYGFIRTRAEMTEVKKRFQRSLPAFYDEKKLGFEERYYLFFAYTAFCFFIRNIQDGHRYALKLVHLFSEYPEMKYSRTEFFIKALNQLLVAQNKLHLTDDFLLTHRQLALLKRDKKIKMSRNINLHLFKAIYIHEINKHFMLGDFTKGVRVVNGHSVELARFVSILDKNTTYLFYYKIACLYFGANQFRQANTWLSLIVRDESSAVREDLQSFARLMRLVCFFELNDDDGVQFNIKATYRFLLRKKTFNRYEQLIIQFLKGLKGNESSRELMRRFILLKTQMVKISSRHFEQRSFMYFDIISWLDSKIQNKTVQEVYRENLKIKNRKAA